MGANGLLSSMFHRRLVLLVVLGFLPVAMLWAQLIRLTVVKGDEMRAQAEGKLVITRWEPTTRGSILDRKGRILAQDRPSFDLALDYSVIHVDDAGRRDWAQKRAGRAARAAHPERWTESDPGQRAALIDLYLPFFEDHVRAGLTRIAREAGVDRADLEAQAGEVDRRVQAMVASLRDAWASGERRRFEERGREITTEIEQQIDESVRKQRILEQEVPHTLVRAIDDELAFRLMRLADQTTTLSIPSIEGGDPVDVEVPLVPGLSVNASSMREYPFARMVVDVDASTLPPPLASDGHRSMGVEGVATQLIGWMTPKAQLDDTTRRDELRAADPAFDKRVSTPDGVDRGRYLASDPAPRAGVELAMDAELRGLRGLRKTNLETGADDHMLPEPGRDIHLTIDALLQARVQAVMDPALGLAAVQPWQSRSDEHMPFGTEIYGAAVVLEVDTGQVLAMVSTPSFTRDQLADDPASVFNDPIGVPWINKAVNKPYPPGSIAKAIVLAEAITRGVVGLHERIECTGHFFPNDPNILRCWIYRPEFYMTTHSANLGRDPDGVDALMVSCNIFFYTLGHRLGPKGIAEVYRDFGVDWPLDLGIGRYQDGFLGRDGDPASITSTEATMMGMGQGPVAWTPLHAANAFATLARGGVWIEPRVVDDGRAPEVRDLELDPAAVSASLQGLYKVVNDTRHGTAHTIAYPEPFGRRPIFNVEGVDVWGKTGTAQASPIVVDPDEDEETDNSYVAREGDHSWFTCLVAPRGERPRYAISVISEHAGSGGRVSGPIANQIIHALKTEGYLDP